MRKLTYLDKEMILQSYKDAAPTSRKKTIDALAKTCDVDVETIELVIKEDKLKKKRVSDAKKTKEKPKEDDVKIYEPVHSDPEPHDVLPTQLPEFIKDILFERYTELETEVDHLEKRLHETQQKYGLLKKYLFGS